MPSFVVDVNALTSVKTPLQFDVAESTGRGRFGRAARDIALQVRSSFQRG